VNGALTSSSGILLRRKLHLLPFAQAVKGLALNAARVKKQFRSGIGFDKSKTSIADDLCDCALHDALRFPP
jgi:hypothetical protein